MQSLMDFWTQKESIVKGDERVLSILLSSITFAKNKAWVDGVDWHLHRLQLGHQHSAYLATNQSSLDIKMMAHSF